MRLSETILITGSTGFIGGHISNHISKSSFYEYSKLLTPSKKELDLTDSRRVLEFVKINRPTILIHCAAVLPEKNEKSKIKFFNNLIDTNIANAFSNFPNSKCIYFSCTSIYAKSSNFLTEESLVKTENDYFQAKIDGENIFSEKLQNKVILRVSAPYGSNQNTKTVIQRFIELALKDYPLYIFGKGERVQNFTYIIDILNAIEKILIHNIQNGTFNICSDDSLNMRDLAEIILNVTNSKSKLISLQELDPDDNTVLKLSNEKAKKILKWYPEFDIKAGIMDMLNKDML